MQSITWIDRIANESNLWLGAMKCEDQRDFPQAVTFYLRDASDCLARKAPINAALSCSCAAGCLSNLRLYGSSRLLYREAALLYLERAESTAGRSGRELLWCLKEAWYHFQIADDREMAEEVFKRFSTISRRVDPFPIESVPMPMPRPRSVAELEKMDKGAHVTSAELDLEVKIFLNARRSGRYELYEPSHTRVAPTNGVRDQNNEKSVINQLG
jgi:hypothetical protein